MVKKRFNRSEIIIKYGDVGHEYYVLYYGSCKVSVYIPGTKPTDPQLETKINFVKTLQADPDNDTEKPMIGFGEIALLYNDKRTASVTAMTECEAWVLSGDVFKQIIAQNAVNRRNVTLEYLNHVELFNVLETYEKLKLIDGIKIIHYSDGKEIIHEGEVGTHFYIVEKGEIICGHYAEDSTFK